MAQRKPIAGRRSCVLYAVILAALALIVAGAGLVLVVRPELDRRRQAEVRLEQAETHYQAGVAFQNMGDWEAAEAEFKQAIALAPDYKDAQTRLAEVKARLAQSEATATAEAIAQAEQARADAQATATAQAQATATAQAVAATATMDAVETHYQKGLAYINLEKWAEAQMELETVFEVDPNYKDVQAQLAVVNSEITKLMPTATPTPSATPIPTQMPTPAPTPTPKLTSTPTLTKTPSPISTPTKTLTPTRTPQLTATAQVRHATATAVASQRVIIDDATHHLGDDDTEWELPNPEGKTYFIRFWLENQPDNDALLYMDTWGVHDADPIWVNDNFVGSIPGNKEDKWQVRLKVFIPSTYLREGENELKIESIMPEGASGYDDFMFRKLELNPYEPMELPIRPQEITVDDKTRHIGKDNLKEWEVPSPESTSYVKFFELSTNPKGDGILVLKTYRVGRATPVRINGNLVGNLPGTGEAAWTPDVRMMVPRSFLKTGPNRIQIGPTESDFMLKDIRLEIALE